MTGRQSAVLTAPSPLVRKGATIPPPPEVVRWRFHPFAGRCAVLALRPLNLEAVMFHVYAVRLRAGFKNRHYMATVENIEEAKHLANCCTCGNADYAYVKESGTGATVFPSSSRIRRRARRPARELAVVAAIPPGWRVHRCRFSLTRPGQTLPYSRRGPWH